jgi:radical SAM-linked protein
MSKTVRFRFGKKGQTQFVSHLDLMRCMERSFRRAGIPLEHTEGFNPHPKLSFSILYAVNTVGIIQKAGFFDS